MQRRSLLLGVLAAALALFVAGPASAATLRGTVVHKNRSAHKVVLATSSGRLAVVKTTRPVRIGRVVRVTGTRLRSGAWSARSIRTVGRSRRARLRGTVTYASRSKRAFTVSTSGASVLIHQKRLSGRTARAAGDTMPTTGEQVAVDTTIQPNDDLEADDVQNEGQNDNGMKLEGKVLSVDQAKRQITVAADDDDQSGGSVPVTVPQSFDLNQFQVGNEVELTVAKQPDGSFLLTKTDSENENDQGDNNDNQDNNGNNANNDNKDNGGGNGDNGGDGGGGGGD
jgi:hypothetical protein